MNSEPAEHDSLRLGRLFVISAWVAALALGVALGGLYWRRAKVAEHMNFDRQAAERDGATLLAMRKRIEQLKLQLVQKTEAKRAPDVQENDPRVVLLGDGVYRHHLSAVARSVVLSRYYYQIKLIALKQEQQLELFDLLSENVAIDSLLDAYRQLNIEPPADALEKKAHVAKRLEALIAEGGGPGLNQFNDEARLYAKLRSIDEHVRHSGLSLSNDQMRYLVSLLRNANALDDNASLPDVVIDRIRDDGVIDPVHFKKIMEAQENQKNLDRVLQLKGGLRS